MPKEPLLSVSGLNISFNANKVLDEISFELFPDETLAIIGPNGAGKTILFHALLGLIPHQGTINWQKGVKIGYVPQRFAIDPKLPLTVNEFFSLKIKADRPALTHSLKSVGFSETEIKSLLKQPLGVLSGGQLQRVLIAWAVIDHPTVLLFDEPTSGVDISAEETIYGLLHRLQEKENLAIMLISHDLQIVYRYANNVVCLNKERVCYGPPHQVLSPKNLAKIYGEDTGLYVHSHHS